ncbi:MAG: hypothetical protein ACPGVO_04045 [Spirulinaceae cyanobacterium]
MSLTYVGKKNDALEYSFPEASDQDALNIEKVISIDNKTNVKLVFTRSEQGESDTFILDSVYYECFYPNLISLEDFEETSKKKLNAFIDKLCLRSDHYTPIKREFEIVECPEVEKENSDLKISFSIPSTEMQVYQVLVVRKFNESEFRTLLKTDTKIGIENCIDNFIKIKNLNHDEIRFMALARLRELIAWEVTGDKGARDGFRADENNNKKIVTTYFVNKNKRKDDSERIMEMDFLLQATRNFLSHSPNLGTETINALNEYFDKNYSEGNPPIFDRWNAKHMDLVKSGIPKLERVIEEYLETLLLKS